MILLSLWLWCIHIPTPLWVSGQRGKTNGRERTRRQRGSDESAIRTTGLRKSGGLWKQFVKKREELEGDGEREQRVVRGYGDV
jgi:hypothetical protein